MALFGGNQWLQTPGAQGYIDRVAGQEGTQSRGAGLANKWLKATKRGVDAGQFSFLNPIREFGAQRETEAEQDAQSNFELRDQPVLRDRLTRLSKDRIAEGTGMQLGNALNSAIPAWMQMSESSQGRLDATKLQALIAAMQGNQASWLREYKPGFLDKFNSITGALGGAAKAAASVANPAGAFAAGAFGGM